MKVLVDAEVADPQAALDLLAGDLDVTVLVVEQLPATPPAPMGQVAGPVPDEAPTHLGRELLYGAARHRAQALEERARRSVPQANAVEVACGSPTDELLGAAARGSFDVAVVAPAHADVVRLLRRRGSPCAVLVVPESPTSA
jgi:hypothetical protein